MEILFKQDQILNRGEMRALVVFLEEIANSGQVIHLAAYSDETEGNFIRLKVTNSGL